MSDPETYRPDVGPHVGHLVYVRKRTPGKKAIMVNVLCVPCRERWQFSEFYNPKEQAEFDSRPVDDEVELKWVNGQYTYVPRS